MPHQFIDQLQEGALVQQFFLLRQVESRTDKTGKPYLSLVLGDKTGTIVGRVWSNILTKCPGPFVPGDYVGVQGQVDVLQGRDSSSTSNYLNTVESPPGRGQGPAGLRPGAAPSRPPPTTASNYGRNLRQLAETHIQPPLGQLVLSLLDRYQEQFLVCPAARLYHHPYLGGLLEHTWFVARHTLASLAIYPDLNPDLALAGAILHDLGKINEIANPTAPELTVTGQLLGHIVLGWDMVREEARALEFPDPTLLMQLEHIILSHHGSLEFGSPIPPKTREALLVNFLDDLDAKLKMMSQHLESDTGDKRFHQLSPGLAAGSLQRRQHCRAGENAEK